MRSTKYMTINAFFSYFLSSFFLSVCVTTPSCHPSAMPFRLKLNWKYKVFTEAVQPLDTELWRDQDAHSTPAATQAASEPSEDQSFGIGKAAPQKKHQNIAKENDPPCVPTSCGIDENEQAIILIQFNISLRKGHVYSVILHFWNNTNQIYL